MYQTVLFDFDGTVFDTIEGITKSVQYALRKHGIEAELDDLRCFAGPPLVDMFMERYGFSRAEGERATEEFRERYQPIGLYECRVFPGIRELLERLRAAGLRVGLATSKPEHLARHLLEREGLLDHFDVLCGTHGDGNDAKWQVVERAMEALQARRESTVLIGDTKWDVAGAHRCGIPCVGVGYGYAAPGELAEAGVDATAADLEELARLLLA
ncbi:MAG: HAD hydrolase-like protein [Oscillospiraceae bacterium]|nr:HAD hydrolase-like protein [Oscillospiraceae bacterium]